MSNSHNPSRIATFGSYRLDLEKQVLYRGEEVVPLQPKPIAVLVLLVSALGGVVSKEELLEAVWRDTSVSEASLTVAVSSLRKAFRELPSGQTDDSEYIETLTGRGYRFCVPVSVPSTTRESTKRRRIWGLAAFAITIAIAGLCAFYWNIRIKVAAGEIAAPAEAAAVRSAVRAAQDFQYFTLYKRPDAVEPFQLQEYWLSEAQGGKEIVQVKRSLERLRTTGRRYGPESRIEQFDFMYTRILAPGDSAVVGTMERWYLPMFEANGNPVAKRNVYLGPYALDYSLIKVNGRWLIRESTTPYARPQSVPPTH